jgi:hypothetical protein
MLLIGTLECWRPRAGTLDAAHSLPSTCLVGGIGMLPHATRRVDPANSVGIHAAHGSISRHTVSPVRSPAGSGTGTATVALPGHDHGGIRGPRTAGELHQSSRATWYQSDVNHRGGRRVLLVMSSGWTFGSVPSAKR